MAGFHELEVKQGGNTIFIFLPARIRQLKLVLLWCSMCSLVVDCVLSSFPRYLVVLSYGHPADNGAKWRL